MFARALPNLKRNSRMLRGTVVGVCVLACVHACVHVCVPAYGGEYFFGRPSGLGRQGSRLAAWGGVMTKK